jgi:hypothetical protein
MKCEKCGNDHDGNFGSGRFCSMSCSNSRAHTYETKKKISETISGGKPYIEKKPKNLKCLNCGKELTGNQRMYCSSDCKYDYKKGYYIKAVTKTRRNRKVLLSEIFHNKCFICGIKDNPCIYDFHHIDESIKEFSISSASNKSLKRMLTEVKNCVMLCSHCHRKLHMGFMELPDKEIEFNDELYEYVMNESNSRKLEHKVLMKKLEDEYGFVIQLEE